MLDHKELRATLILAFPIIFSQLGQMLMGVIDTVMIGRVGAVPLAASALSTSIFALFLIFGFGLSSSVSALVARAHGAQDRKACGEIVKHGLVINLIAGLIMAAMIELGNHLLIPILGQSQDVAAEVKNFFPILGWSLVPLLLFQAQRQFLEGLSDTVTPMIMMAGGILLNVFLNYLWIYGNWGFPAYGLAGAGYATLCARIFMLVVSTAYVFGHSRFRAYLPNKRWGNFQHLIFSGLLKTGLPSGFQFVFEFGAFSGAAIMMGWFGAKTLAGHQIAINLAALTYMITLGISFATSIRISQAIGRGQGRLARKIGFTGIQMAVVVMAVSAVLFLIFKEELARLYIHDEEVISIATQLIVMGAIFQIFDGIQGVAVGALRGMLDVRIPTLITFLSYWVFALPLAYILGHGWSGSPLPGPLGIWLALTLGLAVAAILLTVRFALVSKK